MLIIRGPIKPYIFWIKIILAIFLAKTRSDKTIFSALTTLTFILTDQKNYQKNKCRIRSVYFVLFPSWVPILTTEIENCKYIRSNFVFLQSWIFGIFRDSCQVPGLLSLFFKRRNDVPNVREQVDQDFDGRRELWGEPEVCQGLGRWEKGGEGSPAKISECNKLSTETLH